MCIHGGTGRTTGSHNLLHCLYSLFKITDWISTHTPCSYFQEWKCIVIEHVMTAVSPRTSSLRRMTCNTSIVHRVKVGKQNNATKRDKQNPTLTCRETSTHGTWIGVRIPNTIFAQVTVLGFRIEGKYGHVLGGSSILAFINRCCVHGILMVKFVIIIEPQNRFYTTGTKMHLFLISNIHSSSTASRLRTVWRNTEMSHKHSNC